MVIYPFRSIARDTAPPPCPPYAPHPPCNTPHWHCFLVPCGWMGVPLPPLHQGSVPLHLGGDLPLLITPCHQCPLAGATSMPCKAPASSGGDPSCPCHYSVYRAILLAIDLRRICLMILCTADSGEIHDTIMACANLAGICPRAIPPADLGELYCKSRDLPDSSIPVLPSYDLPDLPAFCTSRPMTICFCPKSSSDIVLGLSPIASYRDQTSSNFNM